MECVVKARKSFYEFDVNETVNGPSTLVRRHTLVRNDDHLWSILYGPILTIWRHRNLLRRTTLSEVRGLYAGSLLGLAWLVIGPLLLLSLYAAIYVVVFRIRPTGLTQADYVLYIFSGLVPFMAFTSSLINGTMSLSLNRQILLNTVFPAELVPLRAVLTNGASFIAGLGIVIVFDVLLGEFSVLSLIVPLFVVLQIMFVAGMVWILSLVTLVLRDVQQILTYVSLALLVASPIAYTPDMIPPSLAPLVWLNPLAYYVMCYQHVLVLDLLPPLPILSGAVLLAFVSFFGGYELFRRAKQIMFDYA
jgi:lipopolysaccharide transport system permease protein